MTVGASALHSQEDQSKRVRVFKPGEGVTASTLVPNSDLSLDTKKCPAPLKGNVRLALVVDVDGQAKNIFFLQPTGNPLDELALFTVSSDRFSPGMSHDTPVPVAQELDLKLQACVRKDHSRTTIQVTSIPEQNFQPPGSFAEETELGTGTGIPDDPAAAAAIIRKVGGAIKAPAPVLTPEAEFSNEARQQKIQGDCLFDLVVDRQGMPRLIKFLRGPGRGLNEKGWEALAKYRFKPATLEGVPVPVHITVSISFRLG